MPEKLKIGLVPKLVTSAVPRGTDYRRSWSFLTEIRGFFCFLRHQEGTRKKWFCYGNKFRDNKYFFFAAAATKNFAAATKRFVDRTKHFLL